MSRGLSRCFLGVFALTLVTVTNLICLEGYYVFLWCDIPDMSFRLSSCSLVYLQWQMFFILRTIKMCLYVFAAIMKTCTVWAISLPRCTFLCLQLQRRFVLRAIKMYFCVFTVISKICANGTWQMAMWTIRKIWLLRKFVWNSALCEDVTPSIKSTRIYYGTTGYRSIHFSHRVAHHIYPNTPTQLVLLVCVICSISR